MVKKEDQSNDSNLSTSSSSSSSNSFINNNKNSNLQNSFTNQTYTLTEHTKIRNMQNLANQLVVAAAAVGNGNPILCTPNNQADVAQVYFQNPNDLTNPYKLQAAVHLISQAAQQQHHQHNSNGLKELNRESNF